MRMRNLQFVYPEPQVVGCMLPAFFEGIRASSPEWFSHKISFAVEEGTIGDGQFRDEASHLVEPAQYLGELLLNHVDDRSRVKFLDVNLRRGGMQDSELWHVDYIPKHGKAIVVSDQNTTLFAHGRRIGIDYGRGFDQRATAKKIANSLALWRANAYEVALFSGRALHTRPDEDITGRLFMRAIVRS